jgi:hypothetical protein
VKNWFQSSPFKCNLQRYNEEEDEDLMDDDGVLVGGLSEAESSRPMYVEVVVGDPHDADNALRARVPLPADVRGGGGGGGARGGMGGVTAAGAGGDCSDPFDHPIAVIRPAVAVVSGVRQRRGGQAGGAYAVRRRWDGGGGACILEVCNAASSSSSSSFSSSSFSSSGGVEQQRGSSSNAASAASTAASAAVAVTIHEGHVELSLPMASLSIVVRLSAR